MKIHAGDSVLIIAGKDKGKQGTVLRVLSDKNRLIVEGINMRVRHIKKTPQQAGQRITYEASLAASNVMILDPKTKKPTRIGYRLDEKLGKKVRFAKVSGEVLPIKATTKATEKKTRSSKNAKNSESDAASTAPSNSSNSSSSLPKKTPFWKRAFGGAPKAEEGQAAGSAENTSSTPSAPVRRSRESS